MLVRKDQLGALGMSFGELQARFPVFSAEFTQVEGTADTLIFQTDALPVSNPKDTDEASARLRKHLKALILYRSIRRDYEMNKDQKWALYEIDCGPKQTVPEPCAVFCVAYYLSSLVRYQPHVLDTLLASGDAWVIDSFLSQCPLEFVYALLHQFWRKEYILKPAA
jgi:YaaC-like Protein